VKVGNLQFPRNAADKPLALSSDGKFLSAKDIAGTREFGAGSLSTLSPSDQLKLTVKRYEMEPDFKLGIFGNGLLTKAEVLQEIKAETDFGQLAVQVEMGYCTELLSSLTGTAKAVKLASMPKVTPVAPLPPYKPLPGKKCILIPMKTRVVFCENTTDSITGPFAAYRIANVHPQFAARGFTVVSLEGTNDLRLPNFVPQATNSLTVYLSGIGHGNATTYTGQWNSPILQVGAYGAAEVSGKAIHFLSCQTAITLGPDTVAKGALCYAGYNANFTFVGDNPATPGVNEMQLFMKADSTFDIWMANGLTADQARAATIAAFNAGIAVVPGTTAAAWLAYDRDHFRLFGNVTTKILPVRMVKVCFPLMSLESENALLALGELVD